MTIHLDSVQNAHKALCELNGRSISFQEIRVRFGHVVSPNVWLGNLTSSTDYKAVQAMLSRYGNLASFKAYPEVGQVLAEYPSESIAQIAAESLKGETVERMRLLVSDI